MNSGIELIAAERNRQIEKEGWSAEHDDAHGEDLADAAFCYLKPEMTAPRESDGAPYHWPWDKESWKPTDRIRDLVKSGALIAAEIDRLQRRALVSRS